jgi:serine/threonine protein kinase
MPEPQPHPNPNDPLPEPRQPAAPTSHDGVVLDPDGISLDAEPSDDTPTIISKNAPPPPPEETLALSLQGRRLAHFELLEPIGVGGMGAVLRARDTQLDRPVALKVLPPDLAQDAENIRRFHQEARAAARLDHENIARVFFCGEDQRLHFIAFEFVEGDNLRTILERRGRLPVGEAIHYALQIAAGLSHASQRGVVHRDIKPSNIIITPAGRAKLVDMGLARSQHAHPDAALTQSGVTLGTFDYISPEQALEPRDADVRSDIYSLGCTLYHMLTGQPPVPEGTAAKKLHHHQHIKPPDPRQLVPGLPDEVAIILDRMMAKQPKDRYQNTDQLVHHLLAAARKLGSPDLPEGMLSLETSIPHPPSSRPLLLAAAAACAVIGLIFFLGQPAPESHLPVPRTNLGPSVQRDPTPATTPAPPPTPVDNKIPPQPPAPEAIARYDEAQPSIEGLVKFLEEHQQARKLVLLLSGRLQVSDPLTRGRLYIRSNQDVEIRRKNPKVPAEIAVKQNGEGEHDLIAALTIASSHAEIDGISFTIDASNTNTPMTGLLFLGGQLVVRHCEFEQRQPRGAVEHRLESVVIETSRPGSSVQFEGCAFTGFARRPRPVGLSRAPGDDAGHAAVMPPLFSPLEAATFAPAPGLLARAAVGAEANEGRLLAAAVAADDPAEERPGDTEIALAQDAIAVRGPARVDVRSCVFSPHAAVFRLEKKTSQEERASLNVSRCTVLASGACDVCDIGPQTGASLDVTQSLIARVSDGGAGGMAVARSLLLHQETQGQVRYTGHGNRYHNLDGYWVIGTPGDGGPDWDHYQKEQLPFADSSDSSQELAVSPWNDAAPLARLLKRELAAAFRLKEDQPALRIPDETGREVVGADEFCSVRYPRLAPLDPRGATPNPAARTLIVEKDRNDPSNGIYQDLRQAILALQPGDVVEVRVNGEVKLLKLPALAGKPYSNVTIRAARGYQPVVVLDDNAGPETDVALFPLHDGRLLLEDLEFRLQPGRDEWDGQAVVALFGDGECVLRHCVITLARGDRKATLALAILPDLGKGKMMDVGMTPIRSHDKGPRLQLENCFVRGEGDCIKTPTSRPCEIDVRNSLLALKGSFLRVDATQDGPAATGSMDVRLDRLTTCLTGHLVRLRAGRDLKVVTQVAIKPTDCLFVPAGQAGDRGLVHLEGAQSEQEEALRYKVPWEGGRNAYGKFNTLLDFLVPEDGKMPQPLSREKWKTLYSGETASIYDLGFTAPPASAFPQSLPADFKPDDTVPASCGVDGSTLPRPRAPKP